MVMLIKTEKPLCLQTVVCTMDSKKKPSVGTRMQQSHEQTNKREFIEIDDLISSVGTKSLN